MTVETLDRVQASEARALLYLAVADILEHGPTSESLATLRNVESLVDFPDEGHDSDLLEAEHYSLFGRSVLPYSSAFLEVDGRLGGTVSHRFAVIYDEAEWVFDLHANEPDHFGTQFRFLAFLARMNQQALHDNREQEAEYSRRLAHRFIDNFQSLALPSFIQAVSRTGHKFYSSLLETAWQVVVEQLGSESSGSGNGSGIGGKLTFDDGNDPPDIRSYLLGHQIPEEADLQVSGHASSGPTSTHPETDVLNVDLSNSHSSIRDIVEYLTSCRRSGLFISQSDITALSRAYSLPRGFGSRTMTLTNLIRTAASLDQLDKLIESLVELVGAERDGMIRLVGDGPPSLRAVGDFYIGRLLQTEGMLKDMLNDMLKDTLTNTARQTEDEPQSTQ